ncbi:MAG: carbohydrate kinase family protein [Opitutales bacterium]
MRTDATPILAAGTFVVDYHKVLDHYPKERCSAHVQHEQISNGGAPFNLLLNLARLGVSFPLHAAAKVGRDLDGKYILECCEKHQIDITQVGAIEGASTGFTDVFTVARTGQHTCFHSCGIGDTFSRKDVRLKAAKPKILFLGSLGALGKMDEHNQSYGRTGASQLLREARKQGITTVVEIAPIKRNVTLDDYTDSLKEADYLIINDRLTERLTAEELYTDGHFDPELAVKAARIFLDRGLRKAVIIRASVWAVYLCADGSIHQQQGFLLPKSQRVGSAGVDHAFCAGFIEGLYHDKPIETCLTQGLAVVTSCRRNLTPSDGIPPLDECLSFYQSLSGR